MRYFNNRFVRQLLASTLDLAPILIVIVVFQTLIIQRPIANLGELLLGTLSVILGLTLFMIGLTQSLFPVGESMANAFARKGSLAWLLLFAFCLGFGTTVAEPALIAVTDEAARIAASGGLIAPQEAARSDYALGLRLTVAASVGVALLVGVIRIIQGWSLTWLIMIGYALVIIITPFAPDTIIGVAYDAGGVTTSTLTVPLVTALGVGLATSIKGRNPVTDGFGLIAFASLTPMIFVMAYGILR
ncbi:MAG: DUF1538 domain-containing protein [Methylococcales bacterium]|nr:DUF1538 domain-containing protein [Methylococcales bacterium]